jgi:hypothetical protein
MHPGNSAVSFLIMMTRVSAVRRWKFLGKNSHDFGLRIFDFGFKGKDLLF